MEEGHVKALMSRTHQMEALVNEDNPRNDRPAAGTATTDTMEGDSGLRMDTVSWGVYLYGAIILLGIMMDEQT